MPVRVLGGVIVCLGMILAVVAQQAVTAPASPHQAVPLWANGAPGSQGKTAPEVVTTDAEGERSVTTVNNPSLAPYLVRGAKTPVAAVIIAPGGGHYKLTMDDEGYDVAKYLSGHGVAAFVLKYRLAHEPGSTYTVEGNELDDMQRAIRLVRARAAEWGVDPARVGVMGFSAGGELAVLAATRFHGEGAEPTHRDGAAMNGARDAVDSQSDKPAFEALMYPGGLAVAPPAGTVAAGGVAAGGVAASAPVELKPEIVAKLGKETPPAFMLCGADDRPEIAQGVAELFVAMRRAGVSAEMHEYAGVGHGFGLRLSQHGAVADWPQVFVEWMDTKGLLRGK
jgi:endo-1,4-beta-xylanase